MKGSVGPMPHSATLRSAFQIRETGDPVLKQACAPVTDFGASAEDLEATLLSVLDQHGNGAGLAANQIGLSKRAFAYDLGYRGEDLRGVVFNPILVGSSGIAVYEEGCLSIPDFFWPVERSAQASVHGLNAQGFEISFELGGIAARLFLHEMDHLDGLLIFDRISDRVERAEARRYAAGLGSDPEAPRFERRIRSRRSRDSLSRATL